MEIMTIQGVRGYIDAFGTIHLNAEDVARGLGFTFVAKSGNEVVRWNRVNEYLAEFGYGKEVGKDDFIPENVLYRLAMKASNETAQAFQAKVADEILPTIRRTGFYAIAPKAPTPAADIVTDVGATAEAIQSLFAVKRGIALAQAIDIVGELKNFDGIGRLKELLPPAEHETGFLNATQIGEKIGLNARRVNPLIEKAGLQTKEGKQWRLTEAGKSYGEEMPYSRNGHSGYQIRWNESVVGYLKSLLEQVA